MTAEDRHNSSLLIRRTDFNLFMTARALQVTRPPSVSEKALFSDHGNSMAINV